MKKKTIALFVGLLIASNTSVAAISKNADKLLEDSARKSSAPQVKHNCNSGTCYSPALGDREFGFILSGHLRHMGVDIWESYDSNTANFDKGVYSVAEGIVVSKSYNHKGFGNGLIILHPRAGKDGKDLYSLYLHMVEDSHFKNIYVGKYIPSQTRIGTIGKTKTEVSHLHLELRKFPQWFYPGVNKEDIYTDTNLVTTSTVNKWWINPMTYDVPNNVRVDKKGIFWVTKHLKKYVNRNNMYPTTSNMCKDVFDDAMNYYDSYGVTTALNNNNADFNITYNSGNKRCLFKKSGYTRPESVIVYYPENNIVMGLSQNKSFNSNWRKGYTWDWPDQVEFSAEMACNIFQNKKSKCRI